MKTCPACGTANPPTNRFCRSCGAALAEQPQSAPAPRRVTTAYRPKVSLESERRRVVATVLFADMTGFTARAERLGDPEKTQELISHFYTELAACVRRYGGHVDKFLGDGIMATFGARQAHEDDPERALACALDMKVQVEAVNKRLGLIDDPVGLHIGVNTGLVVTGSVGDESSYSEFTVLGDAVNLASRLEDLSQDGQILVSEETYKATRHAFRFTEDLPPVRVKGKAQPIKVYLLEGRKRRREFRRGRADGPESPFIGREHELRLLDTALSRLVEGTGGFVAVEGTAGIGKSRLLEEARRRAAARPLRWIKAACASPGLGGTLSVWTDAISRLLNPSGIMRRKVVSTRISGVTGIMSVEEARDSSAALAQLLHLDLSDEERQRMRGMDDEALRQRLFQAVREVIERDAMAGPLVLQLNDLHWCDSASMQLLAYVLESTARVPLLIVTDFRSEADTIRGIRGPLEEALTRAAPPFRMTIEVPPLSYEESMALASALLGTDASEMERARLVQYAEGNPYFLEEVAQSVKEQKETGGAQEINIPDSLSGLLLDRIDRLPDRSRQIAQIASVVGRVFSLELLMHMSGEQEGELAVLLGTLEEAGIIERVGRENGGTFRFRQSLMRDAAYSSLLNRRRRVYHESVARWYERLAGAPQPPPDLASILAYHWERAEVWEQAAIWALAAADESRRHFALDEAKEWYRRAWGAADRAGNVDAKRVAEMGSGEIDFARGDMEAALRNFSAALALAHEPLNRAVIERRIGQALDREGNTALALAAFGRAAALLGAPRPDEPPEWSAERARLGVARAFIHLRRGEDALAREAAEAALRLSDLPALDRSDLTRLLGEAALRRGDDGQAITHFRTAQQLARAQQDVAREAAAIEHLARAYLHGGQRNSARAHFTECLALLRDRLRDDAGCGRVLMEIAALDEHAGVLTEAAARLREAIEAADRCHEPVVAATARLRLGRVLRLLGEWQEARALLERAGNDDPDMAGRAALELALLDLRRGLMPEVQAPLRMALDQGERYHIPDLAAHARLGLAFLARRLGNRDEARRYLREVLIAAGGQDTEPAIEARIALAELNLDEGRPEMAVHGARMALEAAERAGPAMLVWSARRTYAVSLGATGQSAEAEVQIRRATEAARNARAYPELARCLADWTRLRGIQHGSNVTDAEAQGLLTEIREVLAYLARGGSPPQTTPPAPAAAGPRPTAG